MDFGALAHAFGFGRGASSKPVGKQPPQALYRYRPCTNVLLERELDALENSYLFAPSFESMNDPMEAFVEVGGEHDVLLTRLKAGSENTLKALYAQVTSMVANAGLISFSATHADFPLWAYYASNFAGFCLEFDTNALQFGDLQGEQLHPVTYAEDALPAVSLTTLLKQARGPGNLVTDRLSRKRAEWAHEREWRYITGRVGKKHLLDTALRRVYLGPRMAPAHVERLCAVLADRPVEVLKGVVRGFDMGFESVQAGASVATSGRVGQGRFAQDDLVSEGELRQFLQVPFEALIAECERLASHPNMDGFTGIDVAAAIPDALFVGTSYRLRSGREIYRQRYYDRQMHRTRWPHHV